MQQLAQHLPTDRTGPRLWFERLDIFSVPSPLQVVRSIAFHRGLNLVWAKEPAAGQASGTRAAGHGVGKTSLCLLLRFCLGEPSDAVKQLREELLGEFVQGGVVAVLHVDGQPYTLCRYFNPHREGMVSEGNVADIWGSETAQKDSAFLKAIGEQMMRPVSLRNIPGTNQSIEWKHVLAWISRDQGSRFKSFFAWRDSEGAHLQRSRQDPPIVMRAVLGLLVDGEAALMNQLAECELDLEQAKKTTEALLQEPTLIKRRIESNLRARGNLPSNLPIRSDDFFADSVEKQIEKAKHKADKHLAALTAQQEKADQAVAGLRAEMKLLLDHLKVVQREFDRVDAARRKDEEAFQFIGNQLLERKQLIGHCEHGRVSFQECQHVKNEIVKLKQINFGDARDKPNLQQAMEDSISRAGDVLERKKNLESQIDAMKRQEERLLTTQRKARMATNTAAIEANKWPYLLEELNRWEQTSGSAQAQAGIAASREKSARIEQKLNSLRTKLAVLQQDQSQRERSLADITDGLTRRLLPDGAFGTFDPRDEDRPFRLSMRGGEAYRVLEVLLGDVACMLDSARSESALPGLFIHDCPREADMSAGLYENFLSLIGELQNLYANHALPFQYIVTTTTPPPSQLQHDGVCLALDPSTEKGLLFCRRFVGERQAALRSEAEPGF